MARKEKVLSEQLLIDAVNARARQMGYCYHTNFDVGIVHARNPLDLRKLLDFPARDFAHDAGGLLEHVDWSTGEIRGMFWPRCGSKPLGTDTEKETGTGG